MEKTSIWLVGHKDSAKKKDWLAVCRDQKEAEKVMAATPEACVTKEVTFESR